MLDNLMYSLDECLDYLYEEIKNCEYNIERLEESYYLYESTEIIKDKELEEIKKESNQSIFSKVKEVYDELPRKIVIIGNPHSSEKEKKDAIQYILKYLLVLMGIAIAGGVVGFILSNPIIIIISLILRSTTIIIGAISLGRAIKMLKEIKNKNNQLIIKLSEENYKMRLG